MSEPLTPDDADDEKWETRPKADGIAVTKRRREWREIDEGLRPEGNRRGRNWMTY